MDDLLKAIVLGVVQGVTEFLPISSSGHLIALKEIFRYEAPLAFDVSLHLATLLAVLIFFARRLVILARSPEAWPIFLRVVIGTIPAGMIGYAIEKQREHISSWFVVAGWLVSALYLQFTTGRGGDGAHPKMSLGQAFLIGGSQGYAAALPGFSRSGISISSGLWMGLDRGQAFEFSFLLAIPVMLGAGVMEGRKLLQDPVVIPGGMPALAASMGAAFLVGLAAIYLLRRAVIGNRFHRFGYYNLAAAILFAIYLLTR